MHYQSVSTEDLAHILIMLGAIHPISPGLSEAFQQKAMSLEVPLGTTLLKEGEVCKHIYYIKKGALMGITTHQKKEIVAYISIDSEFVSSISGLHGIIPSKEAIVAVEDCELMAMRNDDLQELFMRFPEMNFIFRVIIEKHYRDAHERSHIVRVGNAKERYQYFIDTKPGYIERLPLSLVASMLDMKLPTLLKAQKQYQLSLQRDKETEEWCRKIERDMLVNETFKQYNITLVSWAKSLGVSAQKLSYILNHIYQLTFTEFVNNYRIKSIVQQMENPEVMRHFTVEALAKNAGFTSRSAFYIAFKRRLGMTPVRYAKNTEVLALVG